VPALTWLDTTGQICEAQSIWPPNSAAMLAGEPAL
jgi:hypothetical protein